MSENSFYENLLSLPDLKVDSIEHLPSKLVIHCHLSVKTGQCPVCQQKTTSINQYTERVLQDLTIVGKQVYLKIRIPQFECQNCHRYLSYELPFADANKSYTHRQSKWIFELCSQQPFTEVAALVNLSNKTVEHLYYEHVSKRLQVKERFKNVRQLGIDELSHRKGKGDYCCVLTDLERGTHLDILPDRKKETIIAYFNDLGAGICQQIQVVSCDIWDSYILASRQCFPNTEITLDHFHIVKALNESLDAVRKSLRKAYQTHQEFKNIKWLLFKQAQNCTEEQTHLLNLAFEKSPTLHQFYIQRNRFHTIYQCATDAENMTHLLNDWIEQATKLEHPKTNKFIKTLQNWMANIASYANTFATNAVTEGLNNLIRRIKRISSGMPNFEHLRLRVLAKNI